MNPTINEAAELAPPPTPERIFQTLTAYQQTAALKAGIELDIFTAIAEGDDTTAKLAARTGAAERGVRILCDYLTVSQFLGKCPDGRYTLTQEAAIFLNRRSPAYVGGIAEFLSGAHLGEAFGRFTESVRRGGTVMDAQGSMTPEHPMWEDFARGMAAIMRPAAADIAQVVGIEEMESCKILDIAAGHGIFGITLAERNERAQVYAVDWRNVLAIAQQNAEAAGVAARYHLIHGSAFDVEYGDGYDLVLFTNFFHHFDPATCEVLMRRANAALKAGGRAVTLEFVPNEDRVTPPVEAAFALVMLGTTPSGDAYTFAEFERMFRNAGFSRNVSHQTMPGHIIVSYKE
ncbi:MAG TPA: class I SAM-dependent methyltransferase [Pyrinomonadaceae bacterium]|nr:class I SAM-dependent methyltransferase [Pyrinomonadaceae bacterium]